LFVSFPMCVLFLPMFVIMQKKLVFLIP